MLEDSLEEINKDRQIPLTIEDLEMIYKGYRPRNMSTEEFKALGKLLKEVYKIYSKGKIFHLSKVSDAIWEKYTKDLEGIHRQRSKTYEKDRSTENK